MMMSLEAFGLDLSFRLWSELCITEGKHTHAHTQPLWLRHPAQNGAAGVGGSLDNCIVFWFYCFNNVSSALYQLRGD